MQDPFLGFSTDEETLVKLGFQTNESDYNSSAAGDNKLNEDLLNFRRVNKKKKKRRNNSTIQDPFTQSILLEMDEEEFAQLFKFPNEPIFCTKEIFDQFDEFIDITLSDQDRKIELLKTQKKKKKRVKEYSPKIRWNRINKSLKRILMAVKDEDSELTNFIKAFEMQLRKIHEQGAKKREKLYIRFNTSFQKYLSIGICDYYLLRSKHYDSKKVIVVDRLEIVKAPLPKISLLEYLCSISKNLEYNEEMKKEIKLNRKKLNQGDFKIEESEFFKIGEKTKKK